LPEAPIALVRLGDFPVNYENIKNNSKREIGMALSCFRKKDTGPPICGVHHVLLVAETVAIDHIVPHLGQIPCFVCPVSHQVLADPA
jgi:hypothetical protein